MIIHKNSFALITTFFLIILNMSFSSCDDDISEPKLISFKNYSLEQTDFNLGLGFYEGCQMKIVNRQNKYTVYVTFNNTFDFIGNHIKGDYKCQNDTIFLNWKYIEELDNNRNKSFYDANTIVYEYEFITDDTYNFIFIDSLTNCNTVFQTLHKDR